MTMFAQIDDARCTASRLMSELQALHARLGQASAVVAIKSNPAQHGIASLVRSLARERDRLLQLVPKLEAETDEVRRDKRLEFDHSCIYIGRVAVEWDILRRSRSLVSLHQAFQGSDKQSRQEEVARLQSRPGKQRGKEEEQQQQQQLDEDRRREQMLATAKSKQSLHRTLKSRAKVEVHVVEGGAEWIDIKALTLDRLARQMTDAGWAWGDHLDGEKGEEGEEEDQEHVDPEEWESAELAVYVRRLIEAARRNRHEYVVPRIRLVLPRIARSDNEDVALFLTQLTRIDPLAQVIIEDRDSDFLKTPPPPLEESLGNLAGDELANLTPTLNIDHTILIDLISDITHTVLEPQPWQARTTRTHIDEERQHEGGLMARSVYPILQGRKLVCTREAAEHFHEVLKTVGTATERQRGCLLVPWGENDAAKQSAADIRSAFQAMSVYPFPPDVQIPVTVLDTAWSGPESVSDAVDAGLLPPVAVDVVQCGDFGSSKLSIYMQGWASGDVTVTSNKEIRGQIRRWIEAHRRGNEVGPKIYRLDVTRNLLAKSATPPEGWND